MRNSANVRAFVRAYDCISACNGSCISRTVTHLPSDFRTTGPWCVRYTEKTFLAIPFSVLYGTETVLANIGRSSRSY